MFNSTSSTDSSSASYELSHIQSTILFSVGMALVGGCTALIYIVFNQLRKKLKTQQQHQQLTDIPLEAIDGERSSSEPIPQQPQSEQLESQRSEVYVNTLALTDIETIQAQPPSGVVAHQASQPTQEVPQLQCPACDKIKESHDTKMINAHESSVQESLKAMAQLPNKAK